MIKVLEFFAKMGIGAGILAIFVGMCLVESASIVLPVAFIASGAFLIAITLLIAGALMEVSDD
jgi:hypothetical protein